MSRPFLVGFGTVAHAVEPNPGGWYDVTSARSGHVYHVHTDGSCTCEGHRWAGRCSHVDAGRLFAAGVLAGREQVSA